MSMQPHAMGRWEPIAGTSNFTNNFWPLNWYEDCLIWLAIANCEDSHFKFLNLRNITKVIRVVQGRESLSLLQALLSSNNEFLSTCNLQLKYTYTRCPTKGCFTHVTNDCKKNNNDLSWSWLAVQKPWLRELHATFIRVFVTCHSIKRT